MIVREGRTGISDNDREQEPRHFTRILKRAKRVPDETEKGGRTERRDVRDEQVGKVQPGIALEVCHKVDNDRVDCNLDEKDR